MAERYLVDSDVLIDHLRGTCRIELAVTGSRAHSIISRVELFSGDEDEHGLITDVLAGQDELAVTSEIAEIAGQIRRHTRLAAPDAIIAATALVHDLPLVTRNIRHFELVPGLRVIPPRA